MLLLHRPLLLHKRPQLQQLLLPLCVHGNNHLVLSWAAPCRLPHLAAENLAVATVINDVCTEAGVTSVCSPTEMRFTWKTIRTAISVFTCALVCCVTYCPGVRADNVLDGTRQMKRMNHHMGHA